MLGAKSSITIGRSLENDVVIHEDVKISRQHLRLISAQDGTLSVQNLSDKSIAIVNGTTVPAKQEMAVTPGSRFQIGDTEFELRASELPSARSNGARPTSASSKVKRNRIIIALVILIAGIVAFQLPDKLKSSDPLKLRDAAEIETSLLNSKNEVNRIEKEIAIKGEDSVQYRLAQENYQKGFRDYLQGQYERAVDGFGAALSFYPQHRLARKYYTLAKRKFEEQIQTYLILGKRYYGNQNYRLCKANMATAVRLDKNELDPARREALQNYRECDLKSRLGRGSE